MEDQTYSTPTGVNGNTLVLDNTRHLIRPLAGNVRKQLQMSEQEHIGEYFFH